MDKQALRELFQKKRAFIKQRDLAEKKAEQALLEKVHPHKKVLSYASFKSELSTKNLNRQLAKEKKLLLPKIFEKELQIFLVESIEKQLERNKWGLLEPIPNLCQRIPLKEIDIVIVPAIAFDREGHRLGYGKGFFDRFLKKLPEKTPSIGVGFKEQLYEKKLPSTPLDIVVKELLLF